jgi:hypothetical protein
LLKLPKAQIVSGWVNFLALDFCAPYHYDSFFKYP